MAECCGGSNNKNIITILAIIVVALALLYFLGVFGPRGTVARDGTAPSATTTTESPRVDIDAPTTRS